MPNKQEAVEQRDKQIKEMAEIIEKACSRTTCTNYECYECYAQALYDAGYLKPPELTVLTKYPCNDCPSYERLGGRCIRGGTCKTFDRWYDQTAQRDHDAKIVKGE